MNRKKAQAPGNRACAFVEYLFYCLVAFGHDKHQTNTKTTVESPESLDISGFSLPFPSFSARIYLERSRSL